MFDARFFDLAYDMMCVAKDGSFLAVNQAWERTLGWTAEELTGRPYVEFVHEEDRDKTDAESERLSSGHITSLFRNRYRTKSGEVRWLDWRALTDPDTDVIYAVARDVTHEMEQTKLLADRERMLTRLLRGQHRIRTEEHRRIAGELHDFAVQHSVAALVMIDAILEQGNHGEAGAALQRVREQIDQSLRTTRRIMKGLDPMEYAGASLTTAIEVAASDIQMGFDVPVVVSADDFEIPDHHVTTLLYRAVVEAMTNAAKHASATCIRVSLSSSEGEFRARIWDDGVGIGPGPVSDESFGIQLMREHAHSYGGTVSIQPGSEGGTCVEIVVPLDAVSSQTTAPQAAHETA
jgi:PAS domain S-box-containing protein